MKIVENRVSRVIREIIKYSAICLAVSLIFIFGTYLLYDLIDPNKPSFDKTEKSLQVGVAVGSFLSLLISFVIYKETDKRQVQLASIVLFDKFRDDRFTQIRDIAWRARGKYEDDEKYKKEFIELAFSDNTATKQKEDSDEEERKRKKSIKEEIKAVRDLLEFYHNLIIYKDIPEAVIERRYFYYGWWRPFLYVMAELHDSRYLYSTGIAEIREFNYDKYKENISYVNKLKQIDIICGFNDLPFHLPLHRFD